MISYFASFSSSVISQVYWTKSCALFKQVLSYPLLNLAGIEEKISDTDD